MVLSAGAVHETTVQTKALIAKFYDRPARLSYWNGCSTGGRQGLKEAQMFPNDYDAIIAGAPANRTAISLWIASAVLKDPASYIPPAKYPVIHQAAVAACVGSLVFVAVTDLLAVILRTL